MNGRNPTRNEKWDAATTTGPHVLVANDKQSDGTRKRKDTLFRLVAMDR
jgi:hypothetical protein